MLMTRLPDWQMRLTRYLAAVARRRFEPGAMDCALFAAGAVEAQTGTDLAAAWRGHYSSLEEGLQRLEAEGHADHVALLASLLSEIAVEAAEPGDIAVLPLGRNLPALGVFQGEAAYVLVEGSRGFMVVQRSEASRAFRVAG